MVIVPRRFLVKFILGDALSPDRIGPLIRNLEENIGRSINSTYSRDLLVQICQCVLNGVFKSGEDKDRALGHVASAAIFLGDTHLFKISVDRARLSFGKDSYYALGARICFADLPVYEHE